MQTFNPRQRIIAATGICRAIDKANADPSQIGESFEAIRILLAEAHQAIDVSDLQPVAHPVYDATGGLVRVLELVNGLQSDEIAGIADDVFSLAAFVTEELNRMTDGLAPESPTGGN